MFLVLVRLRATAGGELPPGTAELLRDSAPAAYGIEHVTAIPGTHPDPVLAFYVLSRSAGEAALRAEALCRQTFVGWRTEDTRTADPWPPSAMT
ncbi:hypothetical protein ACWGJT_33860 [Streptomyces xantholiticus]